MRRLQFALTAALVLLAHAAQAVVIGFDSITGHLNDPYFGHIEQGFQVDPILGDWMLVTVEGNPLPCIGASLFTAHPTIEISIHRTNGGLFTVNCAWFSFDHRGDYRFEGFLDGTLQYTYRHPMSTAIGTRQCPFAAQVDFATITLYDDDAQYRNIDSINVTPVPEPPALTTIALGLLMASRTRRRRSGRGEET